jgi:hypothetical protein
LIGPKNATHLKPGVRIRQNLQPEHLVYLVTLLQDEVIEGVRHRAGVTVNEGLLVVLQLF